VSAACHNFSCRSDALMIAGKNCSALQNYMPCGNFLESASREFISKPPYSPVPISLGGAPANGVCRGTKTSHLLYLFLQMHWCATAVIVVQVTSVKEMFATPKLSFICLQNSTRDGGGVLTMTVHICATHQASSMQLLVARHPTGVMRALCPSCIQVSAILVLV